MSLSVAHYQRFKEYTSIAIDHPHSVEQFDPILRGFSNYGRIKDLGLLNEFNLSLSKTSFLGEKLSNCQFIVPDNSFAVRTEAIGCVLDRPDKFFFEVVNVTHDRSYLDSLKERVTSLTSQNETVGSLLSHCRQTSFFARPSTLLGLTFVVGFVATIVVLSISKYHADKNKED